MLKNLRLRNPIKTMIDRAVEARVNARLASLAETDDSILVGTRTGRQLFQDRFNYDRETILRETLLAWRTNPIARRLTDTLIEFVVGDGMQPTVKHKPTAAFLKDFWEHPLNNLDEQIPEWVAEQSRTGDLFLLCSVDALDGMTYVRAIPSEIIQEIQTAGNDYRQEEYYLPRALGEPEYEALNLLQPEQTQFVLHFPINRPVGCTFGESDLTPILRWLGRLNTLLNDRVILNHLRNLIVYIVSGKFPSKRERDLRSAELNANPPQPGAIIVRDDSEGWEVLSANLESFEANSDILAIKKHIAAGFGVPLHYLAEPESSTRTTAEAAGTPTFRKFKMRQNSFRRALAFLCTVAVEKRRAFSSKHHPKRVLPAGISIRADDVTERDNSILALAAARIEPVLADLFDRQLIDEPTYLLLFYEMLGKDYDTTEEQPVGIRAPVKRPGRGGTRSTTEEHEPEEQEADE